MTASEPVATRRRRAPLCPAHALPATAAAGALVARHGRTALKRQLPLGPFFAAGVILTPTVGG